MSAEGHSRPTWVEVDLDALRQNARAMKERLGSSALCAVVKANGYGHGAVPSAKALLEGGADGLAVALVDEGIELRQGGVTAPILLLSEPTTESMTAAFAAVLTPTLTTVEGVVAAIEAAKQIGSRNPVHIKVDTGMHRMGAMPNDFPAVLEALQGQDQLVVEGLWTHLSVADEQHDDSVRFTQIQLERFDEAVRIAEEHGVHPSVLHVANSAGSLVYQNSRFSMVRCGLSLYGEVPNDEVSAMARLEQPLDLKPAMSIKSLVTAVRDVDAGERPSYGRRRAMPHAGRVATVPIGYADGFPRSLFDAHHEVLIGGQRFPLAGSVTMDQIVVDVGDIRVEVGDEVALLGAQGNDRITANEWAAHLQTIPYEVLCGFGDRIPRRYVGTLPEEQKVRRRWWRSS